MTGRAEIIEAAARAHDPVGWSWYDRAGRAHPAKKLFFVDQTNRNRDGILAALRAMHASDAKKSVAEWLKEIEGQ